MDDQFTARVGAMRACLTLTGALLLTGCGAKRAPSARLDGHRAELRTIDLGGRQRSYILAPGKGSGPRPLMLIFHGGGGTAQAVLDQTALGLAGVEAGMTVVSMDAAEGTDGSWSTTLGGLRAIDDVAFTRSVIAAISREIRIDSTRILAVGYSRGAVFTFQLACRAPDLTRAIVAVAGALPLAYRAWCDSTAGLPRPAVMLASGTSDQRVLWTSAPGRPSVLEAARYFADRNGCRGAAEDTVPGRRAYWKITRIRFAPCEAADVVLYKVHPLDHLWPGTTFDIEPRLVSWFLGLPKR